MLVVLGGWRIWTNSVFLLVAGSFAARTTRKCHACGAGLGGQGPRSRWRWKSSNLSTPKEGISGLNLSHSVNVSFLLKGLPGQVGLPGEIGALGPKVRGKEGAQENLPSLRQHLLLCTSGLLG